MKEQIKEMRELREIGCDNAPFEFCNKYDRCEDCPIDRMATALYNAGYRKQKEGEWIAKDNFNGRCSIATCSNCGIEKAFAVLVKPETIAELYPYCQKCGAKMKGGAE